MNQAELQNALGVVSKGISSRSTLPILSGVLVEAVDDEIVFQTTNLELSVQYSAPALIEEEGRAVVPGKLFSEIVKSLPDAAVQVEADEEAAAIVCDASSFSIKTLNPDDFPGFPHVDVSQKIEVPFDRFSTMVRRVARVVSRDESRAILTGVLITVEGGRLKMVATDSYRLAMTEADLPDAPPEDFKAVIAGSFLLDIAALPRSEEPVTLALAENQIVVTYRNTVFINRRIEGNFPNYKQLLPDSHAARVGVETDRLVAAVKRTSLLGSSTSPVKFDINMASQSIQLSASSQDVGSARETLPCKGEGEDMEIAFNCAYVLDGLAAVDTDTIYLETQSGLKPGIFKAAESEDFLYLIMPVRIA